MQVATPLRVQYWMCMSAAQIWWIDLQVILQVDFLSPHHFSVYTFSQSSKDIYMCPPCLEYPEARASEWSSAVPTEALTETDS